MVRWAPLARHLGDDGRARIELTYGEIEAILGGPLPASATEHRSVFWTNSRAGGYGHHWMDAGYRVVLRGMPHDAVAFVRDETPVLAPDPAPPAAGEPATPSARALAQPPADVLLVGCVKSKTAEARPARDLYTSELFARRREYAEASGVPWVVLSAEHGAVDPDEVIEPYDRYLEDQPAAYRHDWGQRVVEQLEARFGALRGKAFALHASRAYGDPIEPLLRARGATLLRPLDGLRFGEHLQWYDGVTAHAALPRQAARPRSGATALSVATAPLPHDTAAPDTAEGLARRVSRAFVAGELDLSARSGVPPAGWEGMPEVRAVNRIREHGATDVEVRAFLTLISAMDRARDADRLWDRGAEAFASAPGLFDPLAVTQHSFTELLDELRSTGISQRHAVDVSAWRIICESLNDATVAPAIRGALIDGRGDARELLVAVEEKTPTGSDRFPLLRGPRIRATWVRILAYPGGAEIDNLDVLPVAVDVQVRKVTENLGVTATFDRPIEEVRDAIQQAWADHVAAHGAEGPDAIAGTAAALDPALWFYGTWGCSFCERSGRAQPIHDVCGRCRLMR